MKASVVWFTVRAGVAAGYKGELCCCSCGRPIAGEEHWAEDIPGLRRLHTNCSVPA